MDTLRLIALGYAAILALVGLLNYLPGLTDAEGRVLGVFALDVYDDALHFASAAWALIAGLLSRRAARIYLTAFGTLYLADGLMGLALGSGFLDLGIVTYGVQNLPLGFRVFANLPHIALGGFAAFAGVVLARER
jgi:hypothetical protein